MDLSGKKILVTGGMGFLGKWVLHELKKKSPKKIYVPTHQNFDLRKRLHIQEMLRHCSPDVIIHLAAVCGGIGANRENPGKFFYDNIKMGIEMIDAAKEAKIEKFVQVGTVCAYPKFSVPPFKEDDLWNGYPEETNAPYGIAKKALLVMAQAYRQQYGMNTIYLLPVNLYGPGDNFDLQSSHVIPALIRKFIEAKKTGADSVEIWGTGSAYREFMHVRDCAKGIVLAAEKFDGEQPVNLGTGSEISIKSLVELISNECEYTGNIVWNSGKPDGQPRRCLDTSRAEKLFGFTAKTGLLEGIRETIEWYKKYSTRTSG